MPFDELAEQAATRHLAQQQPRHALERLMRAYGDDLLAYCLQQLPDRALAEDVVQKTFLAAYSSLADFRGDSTWRAWLYGIARHRCQDCVRAEARRGDVVQYDTTVSDRMGAERPDHDLPDIDPPLTRALKYCLSQLDRNLHTAIMLRFVHGCSYKELADILQGNAKTLQSRILRALPVLRRCLVARGAFL